VNQTAFRKTIKSHLLFLQLLLITELLLLLLLLMVVMVLLLLLNVMMHLLSFEHFRFGQHLLLELLLLLLKLELEVLLLLLLLMLLSLPEKFHWAHAFLGHPNIGWNLKKKSHAKSCSALLEELISTDICWRCQKMLTNWFNENSSS